MIEFWNGVGSGPLIVSLLAVFVGALVQRLAGLGLGMIATPVLAIFLPEFLPATILLLGLVIGLSSSAMDRSAIAKSELAPGFAGRALGAVLAAWLASQIAGTSGIAIAVGFSVLLAVALSLAGLRAAITPRNLFVAGGAAGLMGTLTAIGAPPMAMLYQYEESKRSRAMQNVFFAFGMLVSIAALAAFGQVTARHLMLAGLLLPAVLAALGLATLLQGRFERQSIRPWALGLSTTAALILLSKTLL